MSRIPAICPPRVGQFAAFLDMRTDGFLVGRITAVSAGQSAVAVELVNHADERESELVEPAFIIGRFDNEAQAVAEAEQANDEADDVAAGRVELD